jgi:hypothetical protein
VNPAWNAGRFHARRDVDGIAPEVEQDPPSADDAAHHRLAGQTDPQRKRRIEIGPAEADGLSLDSASPRKAGNERDDDGVGDDLGLTLGSASSRTCRTP